MDELAKFHRLCDSKQKKINLLNDKIYKCSIKTTILGKDSAKSEYWHFKDDNTRIYIRMEEEIPINGAVPVTNDEADQKPLS